MKRLGLAVALLASAVAAAATASAATTTTYHGIFSGPVVYKGCTTTPPAAIASGTWSVALHGTADATIAVDIFVNGAHHVSFGGTYPQVAPEKKQAFAVAIPTLAGPLTISLTGDTFSYVIAPYDYFGITCRSVTYSGTLTG
ncbi:MAG TPA: hypothetical protein VE088_10625 [Gaiellaceae bacterium]|jgi:hypothetical protein|nr:hypothetical protein [Gaiellaceae bacterium]